MQENKSESNRHITDLVFYGIGFLAIAVYALVIYQQALNIPKWDDFPEILRFSDRWINADSLAEKYHAFVSRTNEHILLVNHFIILVQYTLTGHLNFSWLIYIGNIFYLGSSLSLWLFFKEHTERAFIFCILILTGVTFYSYDSTLWAMTAISNQAVICFSLLAIYTITRPAIHLPRAMALTLLAVFSQSNGLLLLPVIGIYLHYTRHKKESVQWLVFSIVLVLVYAFLFQSEPHEKQSLTGMLQQIPFINYILVPIAGVTYFGASIFSKADGLSIIAAFSIGAAIIVTALNQWRQKKYNTDILLVAAFLILSILSIIVFRGIILGPSVAFVSRYKMYGAYLIAICIFLSPLVLEKIHRSALWRYGILSLAILFNSWSYPLNRAQANLIDGDLYKSLQRWVEDGDFRHARGYFLHDSDSYLFAALKNKTYNPIVLIPKEQLLKSVFTAECPFAEADVSEKRNVALITHKNPNAAGIRIDPLRDTAQAVTLILCSDDSAENSDENNNYQIRIPIREGGNEGWYFVPREQVLPGDYRVFLQEGTQTWQQENLFINKKNTR